MTGSIQKDIYAEMMHRWLAYAHGETKEGLLFATVEKRLFFGHFRSLEYRTVGSFRLSLWFLTVGLALQHWRDYVVKKGLTVDKEPHRSSSITL